MQDDLCLTEENLALVGKARQTTGLKSVEEAVLPPGFHRTTFDQLVERRTSFGEALLFDRLNDVERCRPETRRGHVPWPRHLPACV